VFCACFEGELGDPLSSMALLLFALRAHQSRQARHGEMSEKVDQSQREEKRTSET
jgi:hypothetical protein